MSLFARSFLILLLSVNALGKLMQHKKYTTRKDLTEHCRKGLPLSVFLGSHVMQSSSQIFQFRRAVLPYSCFLIARSDFGNNIILAMQDIDEDQLKSPCSIDAKQIVVYDIPDTFGGYWGNIPEFLRKPQPLPTNIYTLQTTTTTEAPTMEEESDTESDEETTKASTTTSYVPSTRETMAIEVPIVNISGHIPNKIFEDMFGKKDNTDSRMRDHQTVTTEYPLVEFFKDGGDGNLFDFNVLGGLNQRYHHASKKPYTYTTFWNLFSKTKKHKEHHKTTSRYTQIDKHTQEKAHINKLLLDVTTRKQTTNGKPTKRITTVKKIFNKTTKSMNKNTNDIQNTAKSITSPTTHLNVKVKAFNDTSPTTKKGASQHSTIPDDIPKNMSITKKEYTTETLLDIEPFNPNRTVRYSTTYVTTETTSFDSELMSDIEDNNSRRKGNKHNIGEETKTSTSKTALTNISTNISTYKMSESYATEIIKSTLNYTNISTTLSLALIDRETWENVVLAAPKMALFLNETFPGHNIDLDLDPSLEKVTMLKKSKRDKRYLQNIAVRNVVPRPITRGHYRETSDANYDYLEVEVDEFEKEVERLNVQAQDRISLQYPSKYLGKQLFSLCEHKELQTRHVIMFNTSRIWIHISNLTLESISIILTEARSVSGTATSCNEGYLECQLAGSRVCIDALNACDGIPNCGAYDIYDEDRLRCGYATGNDQTIYLAAFALLVLVYTGFYILMYWLKRCVPKVSEAFFIYSEGAENMLNLHTIMRSPHFDESMETDTFDPNFQEEINFEIVKHKYSVYERIRFFCKTCLPQNLFKRKKRYSFKDRQSSELYNVSHFLESLSKHYEDASVQTKEELYPLLPMSEMGGNEAEELKVLNFCRNAKCPEFCRETQRVPSIAKERESDNNVPRKSNIESIEIDEEDDISLFKYKIRAARQRKGSFYVPKQSFDSEDSQQTTADIHSDPSLQKHKHNGKKLRFDEVAITIKNSDDEGAQRFGTAKLGANLDEIEVSPEASTSKQTKSFWLGGGKKKKQTPKSSKK